MSWPKSRVRCIAASGLYWHNGNAVRGLVEVIDSTNNIVLSEGRLTALIGVEDLVIVHTDEVTLICPKSRAQDVKHMVTKLRASGAWDGVL